ncbi:MAG: ankyrin repeat domain-containing protein, partial [Rickettsiales bacterium]|nr:ankyrin repeat domain-containing protein [Rickettsiales bacterium]
MAKILASSLVVIFFGIRSINAQIENDLYGQQTGDLAGVSSLMLAVSSNDVAGVKFFSRAGGFLINQKNIGGATALHIAARNGNLEITAILLENGADTNILDNEGWSPLMRAAISNNPKVVEALLGKGANAALLSSDHESALVYATISDCNDCLNLIFTKSDLIKTMDTKLLKEQLIDAFIIARNRENKSTQNLLEGYLDRVTKMAPLFVTPDSGNSAATKSQSQNNKSETYQKFMAEDGRVKYILIDDENNKPIPISTPVATATIIRTVVESKANPITSIPAKPVTQTLSPPIIANLVESVMQPTNNIVAVPSSVLNPANKVVTKFKFVSG